MLIRLQAQAKRLQWTKTADKINDKRNYSLNMDTKLFVISIVCVIIGVLIMIKNPFYNYDTKDMLFATKLKVFLSGLLFSLMGLYGIISEVSKIR